MKESLIEFIEKTNTFIDKEGRWWINCGEISVKVDGNNDIDRKTNAYNFINKIEQEIIDLNDCKLKEE